MAPSLQVWQHDRHQGKEEKAIIAIAEYPARVRRKEKPCKQMDGAGLELLVSFEVHIHPKARFIFPRYEINTPTKNKLPLIRYEIKNSTSALILAFSKLYLVKPSQSRTTTTSAEIVSYSSNFQKCHKYQNRLYTFARVKGRHLERKAQSFLFNITIPRIILNLRATDIN